MRTHTYLPSPTMKKSILAFLKDQFTHVPPVITADLSGKTVVVTGANAGLGFQAAKHFAKMKPGRLILGCRNEEKGKAAVDSEWPIDIQCMDALFINPLRQKSRQRQVSTLLSCGYWILQSSRPSLRLRIDSKRKLDGLTYLSLTQLSYQANTS